LKLIVTELYYVVNGVACCNWTEKYKINGESKGTSNYEGKEIFANSRTYLYRRLPSERGDLGKGDYKYDILYELPRWLPASMEASDGFVRYHIEVYMDIPWKNEEQFKRDITVNRVDDLNEFPDLKLVLHGEEVKTFCCLFCESASLLMTLKLPCSGFTPGQDMPIYIKYENKGNIEVEKTKITLKRIIKFNSETPKQKTKEVVDNIFDMNESGVKPLQNAEIKTVVRLPSTLLSSNENFTKVVQVSYILKVEAKVSFWHMNVDMEFPIVIGTVPLTLNQNGTGTIVPSAPLIDPRKLFRLAKVF
jgi:hypothetical protein